MMETAKIISIANRNLALMDGTIDPVEEILTASDIVFAVWPDADQAEGADKIVIKGNALLRGIASGCVSRECRVSAIWVDSPKMALATRMALEDGDSFI